VHSKEGPGVTRSSAGRILNQEGNRIPSRTWLYSLIRSFQQLPRERTGQGCLFLPIGFELGKPTEVSRHVAREDRPFDHLPASDCGVDESICDSC